MDKELVSIADMAAATGMKESDVHRYVSEHPGLFTPATSSGRTLYDADVVEVLSRVQELAGAGLSKQEIEDVVKRSAGSLSENSLSSQEAGLSESLKEAVKAGVASGIHALVRELQETNRRLAYLESRIEDTLGKPAGGEGDAVTAEWPGAFMTGGHGPHAMPEDKEALTLFESPPEEHVPEQESLFSREAGMARETARKEEQVPPPEAVPADVAVEASGTTQPAEDLGHGFSQDIPMVAEPSEKDESPKTAAEMAEAVADLQKTVADAAGAEPSRTPEPAGTATLRKEEATTGKVAERPAAEPDKIKATAPEAMPAEPSTQKVGTSPEPAASKPAVEVKSKSADKKAETEAKSGKESPEPKVEAESEKKKAGASSESKTDEEKPEQKDTDKKPEAKSEGTKAETGKPTVETESKQPQTQAAAAGLKTEEIKAEQEQTAEFEAEAVPTADILDLGEEFEGIELTDDFFEEVPTIDLEEDAIVKEEATSPATEKASFDFQGSEFDIEAATADLLSDLEEKEAEKSWEFEVNELEDTGKTLPDFSEDNAEDTWEFDSPEKKTEKGAWAKEPATREASETLAHAAGTAADTVKISELDELGLDETQKPVSSDLGVDFGELPPTKEPDKKPDATKAGSLGPGEPAPAKTGAKPAEAVKDVETTADIALDSPKPASEPGVEPKAAESVKPEAKPGVAAGARAKSEVESAPKKPEEKFGTEPEEKMTKAKTDEKKPGEAEGKKPGTPEKQPDSKADRKLVETKHKPTETAPGMPGEKKLDAGVRAEKSTPAAKAEATVEPKPAEKVSEKPVEKPAEKVVGKSGEKASAQEPGESEAKKSEPAKSEPLATKPAAAGAKAESASKAEPGAPGRDVSKASPAVESKPTAGVEKTGVKPVGAELDKEVGKDSAKPADVAAEKPAVSAKAEAASGLSAHEAAQAQSETMPESKPAKGKAEPASEPVEPAAQSFPKSSAPEDKSAAEPASKAAVKPAVDETRPEEARPEESQKDKADATAGAGVEAAKSSAGPLEKPAKSETKASRAEVDKLDEKAAEQDAESGSHDMSAALDELMAEPIIEAEPIFDDEAEADEAKGKKPEKPEETEARKREKARAEARRKEEEEETADIILEVSEEEEDAEASTETPDRTIQFNEYNEPTQPPVTPRETRRVIWYMYKRGCELTQIADYLALERVPTFSGRGTWNAERVSQVVKTLERRVIERKQKRESDSSKVPNAMDDLIG